MALLVTLAAAHPLRYQPIIRQVTQSHGHVDPLFDEVGEAVVQALVEVSLAFLRQREQARGAGFHWRARMGPLRSFRLLVTGLSPLLLQRQWDVADLRSDFRSTDMLKFWGFGSQKAI